MVFVASVLIHFVASQDPIFILFFFQKMVSSLWYYAISYENCDFWIFAISEVFLFSSQNKTQMDMPNLR